MTTHTCWPHRKYTKAQTDATIYLSWHLAVTELHWGGEPASWEYQSAVWKTEASI